MNGDRNARDAIVVGKLHGLYAFQLGLNWMRLCYALRWLTVTGNFSGLTNQ